MSTIWAFMVSWFTPMTSLFFLLNLTIFTIILTSRLGSQSKPEEQQHHHQQLEQVPSFLNRVRSFNFSLYKFEQPNAADPVTEFFQPAGVLDHVEIPYQNPDPPSKTQLARSPSLLERLKSINLYSLYSSDSSAMESENIHPTEPDQGTRNLKVDTDNMFKRSNSDQGVRVPERPAVENLKKSASEKSELGSSEEIKIWRALPDEEVDAKADDFINRFKQQLRLQRLESLLRYRELLNRNN
ncbi:hypothetical protein I3843_04G138600 [Carya illinoinensis]|uniref:DUF4408 domain-containing protein n=1 Tax=Carya illinoinensis TaxID=32201 RepID=A0A922FE71_CARIL|nr:hypothetical protein I3842_04G147800 [Carya illinoinensis]KAG7984068.1 hypothetical protein I3843_04G138600 [Carya illinoinensis]